MDHILKAELYDRSDSHNNAVMTFIFMLLRDLEINSAKVGSIGFLCFVGKICTLNMFSLILYVQEMGGNCAHLILGQTNI